MANFNVLQIKLDPPTSTIKALGFLVPVNHREGTGGGGGIFYLPFVKFDQDKLKH